MALKGTLKDFGIADILQLIGQQQKTGVLYIQSKQEEVEVAFVDGNVVRAQSKTRKSRELLGAMLVACGLLTQAELDEALEIQKRTLKRLGDILVTEGKLTAAQLREMTQLQTSETIYKLFSWKQGTYEFVQQDVEHDPLQGAQVRPESMLMEGFRRIDEWPMVRKRVPSMNLSFERLKSLAPPPLTPDASGDEVDEALDAALDAGGDTEPVPRSIGRNERLVFKLAEPDFTVQRLCDLSRLGEFETCKALYNLIEAGYLKSVPPRKNAVVAAPAKRPSGGFELARKLREGALQTAIGLLLVVLFAVAARTLGAAPAEQAASRLAAESGIADRVVVLGQLARLMSALEQFRLEEGVYPARLEQLLDLHLVSEEDLQRPFASRYHYRPDGEAYVLLPPLREGRDNLARSH